MIYRRYISPTEGGYHIEDISPGTDFTDRLRSLPPFPGPHPGNSALVVSLFLVDCRKFVLLYLVPTPTPVAEYDTSLPSRKSYLVRIYCRLACICYIVPDHILATLWVCGIVIVFCKFQFVELFEICTNNHKNT